MSPEAIAAARSRAPRTTRGPVRPGGVASRVASRVAAAWCAMLLLVLNVVLLVAASAGVVWALAMLVQSSGLVEAVAVALVTVLVVLAAFILGVAFGRLLLRAIPPRVTGELPRAARVTVVAATVLARIARVGLAGAVLAAVAAAAYLASASRGGALPDVNDQPVLRAMRPLLGMPLLVWLLAATAPLRLRHRAPRAFLDEPFVLFLRRFSTFSDRTVNALVLRQAPPGVPVVFLTPTRSLPGDWNPLVVGFAGLRLRRPVRSVPIVLRAPDEDWQRAAEELIARARTIVIDLSDASGAMETELDMITRAGRWSDTVCLRLDTSAPTPVPALTEPDGARVLRYRKSWGRALPRLALGAVLVYGVGWLLHQGALLAINPVNAWEAHVLLGSTPASLLRVAVLTAAFVSLFGIPAVDRATRDALGAALRAAA